LSKGRKKKRRREKEGGEGRKRERRKKNMPGTVVSSCNHSTWEAEAREYQEPRNLGLTWAK
jgi:hypothetical protein